MRDLFQECKMHFTQTFLFLRQGKNWFLSLCSQSFRNWANTAGKFRRNTASGFGKPVKITYDFLMILFIQDLIASDLMNSHFYYIFIESKCHTFHLITRISTRFLFWSTNFGDWGVHLTAVNFYFGKTEAEPVYPKG